MAVVGSAPGDVPELIEPPKAPTPSFWAPAGLLAVLTLLFGVAPGLVSKVVSVAAHSLDPRIEVEHLALWHGFNTPLALSALTIAAGVCLVLQRAAIGRVVGAVPRPLSGQATYLASLRGLNHLADRVTGHRAAGLAPDLPRRHPAHGGRRAGNRVGLVAVARPSAVRDRTG